MRNCCCLQLNAGRNSAKALRSKLGVAIALALLAAPVGACTDGSAAQPTRAAFVRTEVVQGQKRNSSIALTGEVQARFRADLSFRVSGRVIERLVEVGAHVTPGQLLARLDPAEQQADLDAAIASLAATESQLHVARTTFERQTYLISSGFTTRVAYDQAQERLRTAEGEFEIAKAQLGRAKTALGDTELRAGAAGMITARNLELGQVVQAAQAVFTLAQDGERDAVFDVPESIFFGDVESSKVALSLVSDPDVTASGHVREVSPVINAKSSTVSVKVAIENPPAAMTLGSPVAGTAKMIPAAEIALPWTALMALGAKPAVWIVDASTHTASLRPVTIVGHEAGTLLIKGGIEPGERVVVDGGKLLSSGQVVSYEGDRS
jgi:membrane fusion protein, multidrug efflux system